jgi:hypothetical protein
LNALSAGNLATATTLFARDAVYEDLTLRTSVIGNDVIGLYLGRILNLTTVATAMQVGHAVGSDHGDGYEWLGVTALVLDNKGTIEGMATGYQGENVGATLALRP